MESPELYCIGIKVFDAFEKLLGLSNSQLLSKHRDLLVDEEQRFRLWAHSLGLHQHGHASLDYRVRDVTFVKERLAKLLSNLQEHLENLAAIVAGERNPIEDRDTSETHVDEDSTDEESEDESSTKSDTDSRASEESYPSSFHEVDFRFDRLTENVDLLYNLAAKLRNPRNCPQRPVSQLYKHIPDIPAGSRAEYIAEHEIFESTIVAHAQRQQIIEELDPREVNLLDELTNQYATTSYWLIHRTGIANARRKQQFSYWKEHALRLSKAPIQRKPAAPVAQPLEAADNVKINITHSALAPDAAIEQAVPAPVLSIPTSATNFRPSAVQSSDRDSAISNQSRLSTVMNLKGERLEWPPPPTHIKRIGGYFTCPYCEVLCPMQYLEKDAWRVHIVHDLQPYHCTYEDCSDPNRLYGSRQDWVNHESQHTRVWHCREHKEELEFKAQADYVEHLETSHPNAPPERYSQELIAVAAGPSLKQCRACPFCPFHPNTSSDEITDMQKHITFHLELLALLALPTVDDDFDGSDRSSESHEVQCLSRKGSITLNFGEQDRRSFADFIYRGEAQNGKHAVPQYHTSQEGNGKASGDLPTRPKLLYEVEKRIDLISGEASPW
ncbi:hypothetical protein F4820DRAFT_410204 [Hypoxylon rubiginosum]|uniref:Uncharacterized protein n=1 Tax=Hypoxylon rubiginosum TaxID=110542 RepID=A0ACB9Z9M8_9PEZI|nr:hypothetical protein F4820DRAFT_410204 [Hypoxylon rubiginosum]